MYVIIWEYQVKPEKRSEFEKIYSANGTWAELFKRGSGYLGTELLLDVISPQHYLTIDRWNSKEEYDTFLIRYEKEYQALDAECEGLTDRESLLGKWHSV